ncbi:MAG: TraR/DksA family transcriptional regulator [Woeseiaceae bacterium]|nr:TraR/DksA family transcriptional regulator [Woeseiaceae bacterium]
MAADFYESLKLEMQEKKRELESRLERITANVRRRYNTDSKEMAKELEDSEVVDALGNEAREEIAKISAALRRMDSGDYGYCTECGGAIDEARLKAYPYADECIDCARLDEQRRERQGA